ncbi:hypothetical protein FOMG_18143 [Fusarium oxysporum f. sp. melonis 26406]|nr:hypothetical protein FOMG_18143 [Fusarium oxysporum f. sp. melonis 26406]
MAHRLAMFYTQLARLSVYQPELEHNPARTRWAFVRRCIRDGTFFVMTRSRNDGQSMDGQSESYYINAKSLEKTTFDNILSQIKHVITSSTAESQTTIVQPSTVNDVHHERATTLAKDGSVASSASRLNVGAVESMGSFMKKNEKAIRRLSSMPSQLQLDDLQRAIALNDKPSPQASESTDALKENPGRFKPLELKTSLKIDPNALLACKDQMLTARMRIMAGYEMMSCSASRLSAPAKCTSISSITFEEADELVVTNPQPLMECLKSIPDDESVPSSASCTTAQSRRSSFSGSSVTGSIAESVIQTPPSRPYETSMALKLKLEGLNRRSRGESVSSRQSFISASSAMDLRRNRSVSSARNASKRMSIDPGHTREQSAGRLLAFKLGALAGERRSFIPPTW